MPKPIRHPNSPYWQYDFQRNGHRFHGSTGTTSRREAQAYIDRKLREIAVGTKPAAAMSLDDALGHYDAHVVEGQPSARTSRSQIAALLRRLRPSMAVADLTQEVLAEATLRRRSQVSDSTVNRENQCLRRALAWTARTYGTAMPAIDWRALTLKEPRERVRELGSGEEARLFAALRADLHPMLIFALLTGCRLRGARTLSWDRVDLQRAEAEIEAKGGKLVTLFLTPSLVALIANQPRLPGVPEVFTWVPRPSKMREKPRRAITQDGWRKAWAEALKTAKIRDFRWHDLRHTFATRFRRAGGDLLALQRALGHSDISSTARYAHVTGDDIRAGIAAIEAAQSRNTPGARKASTSK